MPDIQENAMTQLLAVHPTHPQKRLMEMAAKALQQGQLVVYPTETSYAVACHIGDKSALERLVALRRLPKDHQFALICRDLSELGSYAKVENGAYRILKRNTPGPFTFVLQATKEVPKRLVHAKKKTIGLRVPEHPVAQGLLEVIDDPAFARCGGRRRTHAGPARHAAGAVQTGRSDSRLWHRCYGIVDDSGLYRGRARG